MDEGEYWYLTLYIFSKGSTSVDNLIFKLVNVFPKYIKINFKKSTTNASSQL